VSARSNGVKDLSSLVNLMALAIRTKPIGDIMSAIFNYPYYKLVLHKCGRYIFISQGVRIEHSQNIDIGNMATIGRYTALKGRSEHKPSIVIGDNTNIAEFVILDVAGGYIKIGKRCTVNPFSVLYGHGGLEIGDDVHIATKCTIIPANHGIAFDVPLHKQAATMKGIKIEDDVWVGANVCILDGVTVGTGSVIGAGSVVAKSIPKYSIAAGVPAKVIKSRKAKY
jgi:acetyltransferase-like isoleucine patch superfamily enzyme